jgi:signal transduction histidine kinase
MAASKFSIGSYCLGGASFDNGWLALTIGLIALGVLAITLITAVYDAHLMSKTRQDAKRLAEVNSALQHGKNLLGLATRAAGISSWELDLIARTTLWTENEIESLRAAGVDSQQHPNAVLEMTHPEDVSVLTDTVRKTIAEGKDVCTYRFRVVTLANDVVHLEAHARIFCNEQGQPLRILGVSWDITDQIRQEARRHELQTQLRDASRDAGMAEVATGVLHSVGNVLNSLGVSASLVQSRLRDSRVGNVRRIVAQLIEQGDQVGHFLVNDERGRQTLSYLAQLGDNLSAENQHLKVEAEAITTHVGHIRTIVAAQQTYARRGGVTEAVDIAELVDNAIAIHFTNMANVTIKRDYQPVQQVTLDRHKLIQILGNLLSNARHALNDQNMGHGVLTLRIHADEPGMLAIEVADSGSGIHPQALARLFEFGFTTKKDGHGFGLHTSAILAKDLGGDLTGYSEGTNCGARFVLRLSLHAGNEELAERKLA